MRKIIMAMAVVLLVATGCGDDSSSGGRFDTASEDSSDNGGDTGSSNEDSGDQDSGDESVSPTGADSEFCGFNADINNGLDGLDLFGGPDTVEDAFRQIADNIDQATSRAPAEIRDDVRILSEGVAGYIEVLEEYDFNFLAIPDDAAATDPRLAAVEDPAYEAAVDRVNAYCGFEDEPDPTDEPGTDGGDGDVEGVPDPGDAEFMDTDFLVQIYQEAFGWDAELARCVVEELGLDDPTGALDPSVFGDLNDEICGTTLAELFGGG